MYIHILNIHVSYIYIYLHYMNIFYINILHRHLLIMCVYVTVTVKSVVTQMSLKFSRTCSKLKLAARQLKSLRMKSREAKR